MPSPAVLSFMADNTPHFINFCCCHFLDEDVHVLCMQVIQDRMIAMLELRRLFLNVAMTVV
jgi:hypothetical protein